MTEAEALDLVKQLEEYHGRVLPSESRVYLVGVLSDFRRGETQEAVNRWRTNNSPFTRFPSIAQLKTHMEEARAAQWKAEKEGQNRSPISRPTTGSDSEYDKARWGVTKRAWGMTRAELADAFDDLHRRYPGHDWDGAARRLRAKTALDGETSRLISGGGPRWNTPSPQQEESRREELRRQAVEIIAQEASDRVVTKNAEKEIDW